MSKKNPPLECVDNSAAKGEYHTLNKNTWDEVEISSPVPDSCMMRFPVICKNKEVRIYTQIKQGEGFYSEETEYKLDKGIWRDVRKSQSEDRGKPFFVSDSCINRLPVICKNKKIKVFVEV